jgi:hypothetical protein
MDLLRPGAGVEPSWFPESGPRHYLESTHHQTVAAPKQELLPSCDTATAR